MFIYIIFKMNILYIAYLTRAVEYTDCVSAKGSDRLQRMSRYHIKQSDGQALVMLEFL